MADKDAVTQVMEAFNEFKSSNDKLLAAKADGKAVGDLTAKVEKINEALDKFEPMNQQITLAGQQQKAMQEQLDRVETILNRPGGQGGGDKSTEENAKMMAAFDRVMRKPAADRDAADMDVCKRMNTLIKGNDAGAGYLLAPPEMQKDILKNIVEMTPMRSICSVKTIGSPSYKRPKRVTAMAATRVGETGTRSNTGDPGYGMLEILAPELFARVEVSMQMLEDADYDLLAELRMDSAEQFAYKEGYESINGTGAGTNQCEGILSNPDVGQVGSGGATITADSMIDLYHSVKTAYTRNGLFGLNRTSLKAVRKLKDTTSQYLWIPGIANAAPNTILGAPYVEMPDLPDPAASAYPVLYGDFQKGYAFVDRIGISFQVDYTTGADNGVVVFRARKRTGGGVLLPEALKKLQCA